jgi:hypothetical protein
MVISNETRFKMRMSHLGRKYKPMSIVGRKHSKNWKNNISISLKGKLPKNINSIKGWNKGIHNGKTIKCLVCNNEKYYPPSSINRNIHNKFFCSSICQQKYCQGVNHSMYGKHHSEDTIKKMSGENNHCWLGGKAILQGYNREWNDKLKESIRERDEHTCQICKRHQVLLNQLKQSSKKSNIALNKSKGGKIKW